MPDSDVIAATSETLLTVLADALSTLTPPPVTELHDLQGTVQKNPARLTLFLFDVNEDPSARNRPRLRGVASPKVTVQKPPMALAVRYLLTPWAGDLQTEQKIIGRAMQWLYDHAILSGPLLQGNLALTDQALKISLCPLTLEERTRVWHAVHKPYRLSVTYEVRVVQLESQTLEQFTPVNRRSLALTAPEDVP